MSIFLIYIIFFFLKWIMLDLVHAMYLVLQGTYFKKMTFKGLDQGCPKFLISNGTFNLSLLIN